MFNLKLTEEELNHLGQLIDIELSFQQESKHLPVEDDDLLESIQDKIIEQKIYGDL